MDSIIKKLSRIWFRLTHFYLSDADKLRGERVVRGKEQFNKLNQADFVIVSFGKSGRTWLRMMISRVYQLTYGITHKHLLGFDNLHRKNNNIPTIFFTHDNYLKDYTGNSDNKSDYADKKVILLVRHPADVAVSQYFQWRHRMKPNKKAINDYPLQGEDVTLDEFVMKHPAGLTKVIDFLNVWAAEKDVVGDLLIVRYEDLKQSPETILHGIMDFLDSPTDKKTIKEAVEFSSFDNMKKMESSNTFRLSGGRMMPGDKNNPDSFKVRKGEVGGYRQYFSIEQTYLIDEHIERRLSPVYGYKSQNQSQPVQ
ncbi:MAG: sulfotransferase domain-containing protein [Gammaproteobacteria bacterium]|nr:sulfotransferase domain-containing protein [Gammaproteobacteria bacterium]